jgi:hypothetical protein
MSRLAELTPRGGKQSLADDVALLDFDHSTATDLHRSSAMTQKLE